MKKTIIDESAREAAFTAMRAAVADPVGKTETGRVRNGALGARKAGTLSRDSAKSGDCVGAFVVGGRYEIHASPRFGDVWVYDRGLLAHEEDNQALAEEVIAAAKIAVQRRESPSC